MAVVQSSTTDRIKQREQYEKLRRALLTERASFDEHWRELGNYLAPRRTRFWVTDKNRGDRRSQHIIDSTAVFSARTLASGMHSGLTSPARPWFRLTTPDPDLATLGPVKQWLHIVTQRMNAVFLQTNLYNALPIVYGDMGVFGTAAMGVLEDDRDLFRCYVYPIGSYALGLDRRGLVSTFVRDYRLTVQQLVDEFGHVDGANAKDIDWTKFSRAVKDQYDRGNYQAPVDVTWIVQPNPDPDPDRLDATGLPYTSCHFERGANDATFLRESGFRQFPIMAPRWDVTGEDTYGTNCPGMTALGDVKALQVMQKRKAQAIEKQINPPVTGPTSLKTQQVSLLPGGITYSDVREGVAGLRPVHEVAPDLRGILQSEGQTQYRIQRAFFEDLFLMLAQSDGARGAQPITAREVDERHEEKFLALGPVVERTSDELLGPLIDRAYALMVRGHLLPPPPPELHGVDLRVEYTSIMAQAQKLVNAAGIDRFLQSALSIAQAAPEVRFKINTFAVVDEYADVTGVNPKLVHSDEDASAAMASAQQQAQQAQAAAQIHQFGVGAKALGDTNLEGDSALKRMIEGASSGAAA